LEGEKQNQQLRYGAIFKHPLMCEAEYKGVFVWNSEKREEKNYTQQRRWGVSEGKPNSSFSLEITLTFF
jgi:hypothetical protein